MEMLESTSKGMAQVHNFQFPLSRVLHAEDRSCLGQCAKLPNTLGYVINSFQQNPEQE